MIKKILFLILPVLVIIGLGLCVRLPFLDTLPKGLHWDEVAYGYNAYSLIKTGKDEWGFSFPVFLRSFGDYKPAPLSYTMIVFFQLFGVTNFAIRITPVFFGVLSLIGFYFFLKNVVGPQAHRSRRFAFFSTMVMCFLPWHIFYSRQATDPIISYAFLLLGLWGWSEKRWISRVIGAIFLSASIYTYNSARMFVPLILAAYAFIFWRKQIIENIRLYFIPMILVFGTVLFFLISAKTGDATIRSREVFFYKEEIVSEMAKNSVYRSVSSGMGSLRIFHNKLRFAGYQWIHQYLTHFQADYLFGDNNIDSHNAHRLHGNMLLIALPFLLIGFIVMFRKPSRQSVFFLAWILLAPIPSSLSTTIPHSGRDLISVPAFCYFIFLGVEAVVTFFKNYWVQKIAIIGIFGMWVMNFALYATDYFLYFPEESFYEWQEYFNPIVKDVWSEREKYDDIYFSDDYTTPFIFFLWYNKVDPVMVQGRVFEKKHTNILENIHFQGMGADEAACFLTKPKTMIVLASRRAVLPEHIRTKAQYYFPNRFSIPEKSFTIYDNLDFSTEERDKIFEICELSKRATVSK